MGAEADRQSQVGSLQRSGSAGKQQWAVGMPRTVECSSSTVAIRPGWVRRAHVHQNFHSCHSIPLSLSRSMQSSANRVRSQVKQPKNGWPDGATAGGGAHANTRLWVSQGSVAGSDASAGRKHTVKRPQVRVPCYTCR